MSKKLTIGQLSKDVELPAKTIRFYESIGLIAEANRAENGYRIYPKSAVEEVRLIKNARELGLAIGEIKKMMQGCRGSCEHNRETIESDVTKLLANVREKVDKLNKLEIRLTKLKEHITSGRSHSKENTYCCDILRQILFLEGPASVSLASRFTSTQARSTSARLKKL